ncbi:MAG: ABC transporter permease [Ignavibacteriales bacterium]|nr:ABC transporter permease [Ignavibacteriales bacterium]
MSIYPLFVQSLSIAVEAITHNKLRAILTSLGIVFGVGSVISMLAVGTGAEQEILEQMKLLGANNIIITPVVEQEEGKVTDEDASKKKEKKKFSPGLTLQDGRSIQKTLPFVDFISPEVVVETVVIREGMKRSAKIVGIDSTYFHATDFELTEGKIFTDVQADLAAPVAVIGYGIKTKFFATENPIGRTVKCGSLWLTVIGVLQERKMSKGSMQHLGLRDFNFDVYVPISTLLLRYKNRTMVTRTDIQKAARSSGNDASDESDKKAVNYHQLDRLVVRVAESAKMGGLAEIISRMLERRHNGVVDFQVTVPEQLLKQEQRTKEIFNIVLGAIASISLVVGGIGIMNIMLASVLERTKEVGIRRAIGATRRHVIFQFLSEAVMISVTGGLIGIALGLLLSSAIERFAGINTIVSGVSVIVSFTISIAIGIAFGIFPAMNAAKQDPVVSLRYE